MLRRRAVLAAIGASALAATLAACGSTTGEAAGGAAATDGAGASGSIVVYNAQHEDLVQELVDGFTKQTGIQVTLRNGDDAELGNQLVQEGSASPADVFLTENSPSMDLVAGAGLFAPVSSTASDAVPAAYRPSTGTWTGWAARATVFAYNPSKVSSGQLPASLLDLAQPQWKGRFGIAAGGADFQAIVSAVLSLEGEAATQQWLTGLKANAKVYQGNTAIMKAVNAGELDAGVIYHYYWAKDRAESGANSSSVELHYFGKQDPGAFLSVSGAGVLKSAKNPAAAQKFVEFLTSKAGQEILANSSALEYPIASDVAPGPKLKPIADLQAPTVDVAGLNGKQVVSMMQQAGLI
ncbi:iron ABC transporter substrate-binding protein [Lapillicoccus jejuensis]|uniref:Iron(III) transport system substrate-binding protein n=1 Tax=Lapillicoccus jejuensis TaxID=402171 RepID=A0A542E1U8_9MICO|nr:iron ABC transporter substrate-binding protein [Lapillicoccus jejuensis]TQJ09310.1 iron(III) transport system substrate-binding protein [Lapillicoccus jejuensis]